MSPLSPADEAVLRSLAARYARGVDRRDRDLFLSAFAPDAVLTVPRHVMRGHDEIAVVPEAIKRWETTFHFLGQSAYWPGPSAGTAGGEVYCVAHHWSERKGTWVMYIRYADSYVRDGSSWLIASRRVITDHEESR